MPSGARMRRVLLAYDRSEPSEAALQALLRQFDPAATEVRVVHVVTWTAAVPAPLTFAEGPSAADDVLTHRRSAFRQGEEIADAAVRQLRDAGFTASKEVVGGEPADAILRAADAWRPHVIIVGSHRRAGLDRVMLGSVSGPVVHRAPCAVEVVPVP